MARLMNQPPRDWRASKLGIIRYADGKSRTFYVPCTIDPKGLRVRVDTVADGIPVALESHTGRTSAAFYVADALNDANPDAHYVGV